MALLRAQEALVKVIQQSTEAVLNTPLERWTDGLATSRLELLETYWIDFTANHLGLLHIEGVQSSDYFMDNEYARIEASYATARGHLYDARARHRPIMDTEESQSGMARRGAAKLPRITLPRFSGQKEEWESFRDLFKSLIHNDADLSDVEKLYYLKTHVDGEASKALDHLQITGPNYASAWEVLESRYDNRRLLVQGHLKSLINYRPLKEESSRELQQLLDELEGHRNQLLALDRPANDWDDWFIVLASSVMDKTTRRAWEEELEEEEKMQSKSMPSFMHLASFLQRRCRTLKSIEVDRSSTTAGVSRRPGDVPLKRGPFRVLTTTTGLGRRCPICQESHYLGHCGTFKDLEPSERRRRVLRHSLCFNCLKGNHSASTCPSQTSCRICNDRHHTMIHEGKRVGEPMDVNIPAKVARGNLTTTTGNSVATSGDQI